MTELVVPDVRWHESWARMLREFGDDFPHGSGLGEQWPTLDAEGCAAFAAEQRRQADPAEVIAENRVHCDYFWISDGDELVGFLALRHRLNAWLLEQGGHIGYSVRPSRRQEGHASRALALALPHASRLGLDRVLLTCDEDNLGSRRTIEGSGGVYEDTRADKRRYWIDVPA